MVVDYFSIATFCVSGTRHLYSAQPADTAPKQVQYPVVIINPDNEVECGRKVLFDRTPSAKHDPADYFTSELLPACQGCDVLIACMVSATSVSNCGVAISSNLHTIIKVSLLLVLKYHRLQLGSSRVSLCGHELAFLVTWQHASSPYTLLSWMRMHSASLSVDGRLVTEKVYPLNASCSTAIPCCPHCCFLPFFRDRFQKCMLTFDGIADWN